MSLSTPNTSFEMTIRKMATIGMKKIIFLKLGFCIKKNSELSNKIFFNLPIDKHKF
jgi:16S rRNA U1498 N3-methylase RsmE